MPAASIGLELISEPFLIPVWFYSYSCIVYALSAVISLFITYFSYKFFRMSKSKSSIMFMFSFLFLTVAFASLAFTSFYTYLYRPYFQASSNLGSLSFVNSLGFNLYYITALIAYLTILAIYLPKDIGKFFKTKTKIKTNPKNKTDFKNNLKKYFKNNLKNKILVPVLYVPLWYLNFTNFHIASIIILLYVAAKTILNFYKERSADNFLVMFAFAAILSFHACLLFASFDPTIYLAANSLLVAGFASLLIMLIRVVNSDRRIERKSNRKNNGKKK